MAKLKQQYAANGFYAIGILNNTTELNIGTLWRSAYILGASFIFTVDRKYKAQPSDVTSAWTKIPLYHYEDIDELFKNLPYSTKLVGIELTEDATLLSRFKHPDRAVYLLGNEQTGLPDYVLNKCHDVVQLPGHYSLNVAVAGSIVAHDRISKIAHVLPTPPSIELNHETSR